MKKLLVVLLSVILMSVVMVGCNVNEDTNKELAKNETIYIEELGLTIVLPDTWKDKYAFEKTDNNEYVVYNPNIRKTFSEESGVANSGGVLFYVMKWDEQLTEDQASDMNGEWNFAKNQYIMTTREGTYFLYYASDIQFTEDTEQTYRKMENEIKDLRFVIDNALVE